MKTLPELYLEHGNNDRDLLREYKSLRIDPYSMAYPEGHSYWKVLALIENSDVSIDRFNIIDTNKSYEFIHNKNKPINSFNQLIDTFYDYGEFFFTTPLSFEEDGKYLTNEVMFSMYILHEFCHFQRAKLLNQHLKPEHQNIRVEHMTNFGLTESDFKFPPVSSLLQDEVEAFIALPEHHLVDYEEGLGDFNNSIESEACYLQAYIQKELEIFPTNRHCEKMVEGDVHQETINLYLSIINNEEEEIEVMECGGIIYDELTKIGVTISMY